MKLQAAEDKEVSVVENMESDIRARQFNLHALQRQKCIVGRVTRTGNKIEKNERAGQMAREKN